MAQRALVELVEAAAADGRVSADEALAVRRLVFPDGVVSRGEAGALFDLAARVPNSDDAWSHAFIEAIGDHVLGETGALNGEGATWLLEHAKRAGALSAELLVKVLDRAEHAPAEFAAAVRAEIQALVGAGPMTAAHVDLVRRCLHAMAGEHAGQVGAEEARWLFALDQRVDGAANDPAWGTLFVKAMLSHVVGQRPSALLTAQSQDARRDWLEAPIPASPVGFLARAFEGGLEGWRRRIFEPDDADIFETYYASRLAEAEEDARLTIAEVRAVLDLVRADGMQTANEARLLEEIRLLEQAQSPIDG